jgi:hypothetical protein
VSRKVIETDFENETATSGRTQLVLSAPQCNDSEKFPANCGAVDNSHPPYSPDLAQAGLFCYLK